ncbi:MAG: asparagine synthase C-terminal domain-containing protein [Bacteroidota bacterium]|nr:asparagine synthase C-terminal domain-containing protein [Bacteroidota bacterium]
MIEISVINQTGYSWESNEEKTIWVKGFAFFKKQLLGAKELINILDDLTDKDDIIKKVKLFNGLFTIIIKFNKECFLISDITRTFPIVYYKNKNNWVITDNVGWLRKKYNLEKDDLSCKEFLVSGLVTKKNSLFQNVYQVQAGEIVSINQNKVNSIRYYIFPQMKEKSNLTFIENSNKLKKILDNLGEKLVKQLNGKMAVIPLSGGLDSRLIVSLLKKKKYENVVCFTYGKINSFEVKRSQRIAKKLGYSWYFIPYDDKIYNSFCSSGEFYDYAEYACNYLSIFSIQEYFAVKYLKERKILPVNSVFIPGHAGDFIAGSHLKEKYKQIKNESDLLKTIIDKHYQLNKILDTQEIDQKIISFPFNELPFINILEQWNWMERQSKFIVNACRNYDFFNYEFLLPLWDKDLVDFFSKLPFELRYKKQLYEYVLFKYYFKPLDIKFENSFNTWLLKVFLRLSRNIFLSGFFKKYKDVNNTKQRDFCMLKCMNSKPQKYKNSNSLNVIWFLEKFLEIDYELNCQNDYIF